MASNMTTFSCEAWWFCLPGDIWQYVETFSVVTAGERDSWHLLGGGQGCCWTSHNAQGSPPTKSDWAASVSAAGLRILARCYPQSPVCPLPCLLQEMYSPVIFCVCFVHPFSSTLSCEFASVWPGSHTRDWSRTAIQLLTVCPAGGSSSC